MGGGVAVGELPVYTCADVVLASSAQLCVGLFRYYASFSVVDPFSIGFNVFTDFRCAW